MKRLILRMAAVAQPSQVARVSVLLLLLSLSALAQQIGYPLGVMGAGDATMAGNLGQFASTTSSQLKTVLSDENAPDGASSKFILALGSLSVASGKTFTSSNTLTLAGTDASTLNIGAGGTLGLNAYISTVFAPLASPTFTGTVTIPTASSITAPVFAAGTASAATAPKLTSGTLNTSPEAGALEYDGAGFYATGNTTSGRGEWVVVAQYLMTSNGSASNTAAITDFFPATSSFATVTNGIYEIVFEVFFLKTTAGTMVFTVTNTQTYTNIVGFMSLENVAGIQAGANIPGAGIVTTTSAAAAFPVSGTFADAVNHRASIRVLAECGTAGNIRLRGTPSAGTFTALRGSTYTVRRWASAIVGPTTP